ncbi:MmcQ/YjbR family DNA-binding protein [Ferrimonas aestuarii]|uniref:MmcQ/YjbR family DNA-binding protein n=1 Tax=Ferrimonas aestuarii TaxID=2569539 RepID=A0A4U1BNI5_9GAMM|nr:MmcQ/YjbR family DNA-binding protein [Ferrimonas aestuarii]TKB53332.1 MmcQ/YjbR family DNA-binding protein [Ferrimonas aestuarii]
MTAEQVIAYLLDKPLTELSYPFGPEVSVVKVEGKVVALLIPGRKGPHHWLNLKCDPDEALALRDIFPSVIPAYHMNKKHWNTVILDGSIPNGEIERMMDSSFELVVKRLTKAQRNRIHLLG